MTPTKTNGPAPRLSELHKALEDAYTKIRRHHKDVMPAVITVSVTGQREKLGHWTTRPAWESIQGKKKIAHHELLIVAEHLKSGRAAFETLLHEATHAIAQGRGIQDCSRGGRYHNAKFQELAEEMLLRADRMDNYGFARTSLTREAEERYVVTIKTIDRAIKAYRKSMTAMGVRGRCKTVAMVCPCGRLVRVSRQVRNQGPIICGLCEGVFIPKTEKDAQ